MPETARIRVNGHGQIEVEEITAYLVDLKRAYESILVFEIVADGMIRTAREFPFDLPFNIRSRWNIVGRRYLTIDSDGRLTIEQISELIPTAEQLILTKVQLASPGFWEFLGSLNPLEVLRRYLSDRHERRKDKKYRESAEERRLRLENLILENQAIAGRIKIAKELGATDRDLAPLVNALVRRPLAALDRHQDKGVIENAELLDREDRKRL